MTFAHLTPNPSEDGHEHLFEPWRILHQLEQERAELVHQIRLSNAIQKNCHIEQAHIMNQAHQLQQSLTQSPDPDQMDEFILRLQELDLEFKQITLRLEHEAMKQQFLQKSSDNLKHILEQLSRHLMSVPLTQQDESGHFPDSAQAWTQKQTEDTTPDYVNPRKLRSRPYPMLIRIALRLTHVGIGAIAILTLVGGGLALVEWQATLQFAKLMWRTILSYGTGLAAIWGAAVVWEAAK